MSKLIVTKDFDYRWPSGSLTALIADKEPVTVKREITDYAIEHGYGRDAEAKVTGGEVKHTTKALAGETLSESFVPTVKDAVK